MKLLDYDFDLPDELIAQHPSPERDQSRLLLLDRATDSVQHLTFRDIIGQLSSRDALVLNQTRVMSARLTGYKRDTGGRVELLLIRPMPTGDWLAMGRPARTLKSGASLVFGDGVVDGFGFHCFSYLLRVLGSSGSRPVTVSSM